MPHGGPVAFFENGRKAGNGMDRSLCDDELGYSFPQKLTDSQMQTERIFSTADSRYVRGHTV